MNRQPQPQPERDGALAALLADLEVDQPGPDFWARVDASLAATEEGTGSAVDGPVGPTVLNGSRSASAVATVLPSAGQRPPGRSHRLRTRIGVGALGLAAAVVVAVVVSSALRPDRVVTDGPADDGAPIDAPPDPSDSDSESRPSEEVENPAPATGQPDHAAPNGPFDIGPGQALAFTPDGQGVVTLAPSVDGQGVDLIVYPFANASPPSALPAGVTLGPAVTGDDFAVGRGGHIGWIEGCPGESCTLTRGVLESDGTITDLTTQPAPELPSVTQSVMTVDGQWWLATEMGLGSYGPDFEQGPIVASDQARGVGLIADSEGEAIIWIEDGALRTENTVLATGLADAVSIAFAGPVLVGLSTADGELIVVALELDEIVRDLGASLNGVVTVAEVTAVLQPGSVLFEESSTGGDLSTVVDVGQPTDGLFSPDRDRFVYTDLRDGGPIVRFVQFGRRATGPPDAAETAQKPFPSRTVDLGSADIGCCEARRNNVTIAVEAIDGLVIADGGSLSLNEVLGPRVESAGYQVGGSVVDGILQERRGAGVGVVATALYRAAVGTGLDIEQHQSRALFIDDGTFGLDATIAWPEPDLVLRNRTGTDVWITAWLDGDRVSIQLEIEVGADPVVVELTGTETIDLDRCTEVITTRSRTFPDGQVETDQLRAVYFPQEGMNCAGTANSSDG